MDSEILDILWLTISCALVLLMQAGFMCVETGATRSKNAINVAMKNAADFVVAVFLFWLVGFGLMFGSGIMGLLGLDHFMLELGPDQGWLSSFFLFQSMFCATAVTIVSGVIAERVRFGSYLSMSILVALLIYPVAGHWAWGGALSGQPGWLAARGFVDFAGSTVVHSVGGWVGLAALLVVGPRQGRFVDGQPQRIPGSNAPLALLGLMFFIIGWVGFNGGSTLALNGAVPGIIANTILAAVAGGITAYVISQFFPSPSVDALMLPLNGILAGLVAITANCHAVSTAEAVIIGAIGAAIMMALDDWLIRHQLDDAIGAIPVHLGAGIWGTLAVAIFGDPDLLGTGLNVWEQLTIQGTGIIAFGLWSFFIAWLFIRLYKRKWPIRVSPEDEYTGLNVSEHGARTELVELLTAMSTQEHTTELSYRVPVEPFTEIGQIAACHNRVMDSLEKAVTQTRAIVRDIRDGIVTFTQEGILTSFNPGAEKIFGQRAEAAIGQPFCKLIHPSETGACKNGEHDGPLGFMTLNAPSELLGRRRDFSPFHMEVTITESKLGGRSTFTALVRDINDRRRIEDQLFNEKERALVTLESIADGVITTDKNGRIEYINSAAEQLTGWSRLEAEGRLFASVYRSHDEHSRQDSQGIIDQVLKGRVMSAEASAFSLTTREGKQLAVMHTAAPISNRQRRVIGAVIVFHDVTSARELQKQLSHQATHDSLTGMLNRSTFELRTGELVNHAKQENTQHLLGYLDLDQFKLVNDTCGHIAGDELLRQVSTLIKGQLRTIDIVARLGGDEFGILLRECDVENGARIAEQIRETIRDFRFPWGNKQFAIGVSIGLVSIDRNTENLTKLLSIADAACYAAKDLGRNRVHIYQPDDIELAHRQGQMQWVARIRDALDKDRFRLYFQTIAPINNIHSNGHYEIFVRMLDNADGIIPPGAFIPAAERYNLMQEIDLWVIKNTLAWLGDQQRRSPDFIDMCAINLSGASVGDDTCMSEIRKHIERYRVNPRRICFEITETAAIANLRSATRFIKELKAAGCRFALDDFGSGLSSFGYLKNLPVDYLKIDGAFIKDIANNSMDAVMVQSINTIGHEMGLATIAEFVESEAILDTLREIGVDYVQGYHIDHPRPLEQLEGVIFMPR